MTLLDDNKYRLRKSKVKISSKGLGVKCDRMCVLTADRNGDELTIYGFVRNYAKKYELVVPMDVSNMIMVFYETEILHLIRGDWNEGARKDHNIISILSVLK